jgi:hypothetical protein
MTRHLAPVFAGHVDERGRLRLDAADAFRRTLRTLAGAAIELVVRRQRATRSDAQNKYYWAVVVGLLAEHCGYAPDEMHEALKWKFLRREAESALPTVRSTTSLDTAAFEDFLAGVRAWAATDLGVNIPLPNEVDF